MRDGVTHIVGHLNNTEDPIKLGGVDDNNVVSFLHAANNVDINDKSVATQRSGTAVRLSGAAHSLFVHPDDDTLAFYVESSILLKLNTDFTGTVIAALSTNEDAVYEVINGEVLMTNGVDIGWIVGAGFLPFSQALEEQELIMPAGEHLAYDEGDGCLLVGKGNIIYKSKPYNPEVRDERFSEFPMNGVIRMLATVEDGWWVGTDKTVSFVQRDGDDGLTFRNVSKNPPPHGAYLSAYETSVASRSGAETPAKLVVWASLDGFCEGSASGMFKSLSKPNIAIPVGKKGKVFIRKANGIEQYVAVIYDQNIEETYIAPSINVITANV